MNIEFLEQENTFHLYNEQISYLFQIVKGKYLMHCYYGRRLKEYHGSRKNYIYDRGFCSNPDPEDKTFSLDTILREYPDYSHGDFRNPAYVLESEDGDTVTRFYFKEYQIITGKKTPKGLPNLYVESEKEAMTLEIILSDEQLHAELILNYTIYRDYPVITRNVEVYNHSKKKLKIKNLMSMSIDLQESNWDILTLGGSHVNEKNIYRRKVTSDTILIESSRGASSPQSTPFIGLLRSETTEELGEAIGINFIYSGNFTGIVQKNQYGTMRVQMGMNPLTFCWELEEEGRFLSPEVVMVYSTEGLGGMSRCFHQLYRKHICRGIYRDKKRPILLNSWEAMYFDVSEEKILQLAKQAAELGIELLVLDDGWFQGRDSDTTSLGDWVVDLEKFPHGLQYLCDEMKKMGIQFGIWFEPEMISEKSELYKKHPEWVIRSRVYEPIVSRNQYVLDLSNQEVCDYLVEKISKILNKCDISYVKWDMNRHITDIGSSRERRVGELSHRYILGLYSILEKLNQRFPHVLFEGCSSGGGRFDAGMLYYMPQTWTSDNTDAIARLKIQQGTSVLFPTITMGSHVSQVPNHQVGRITPLDTRFHVAMAANLGYELDVNQLSTEEKNEIKKQIEFYKEIRETVQFGTYYRLVDSFKENAGAWEIVSQDGKEVIVTYVQILSQAAYQVPVIYLKGLDENEKYIEVKSGNSYGGDELMFAGITIPRERCDFKSFLFHFRKDERM